MTEQAAHPQGWSGGDPADLTAWTLVRAYHLVGRLFYGALAPHGLNPQQLGVLICLARRPDLSQADIAREVLATPQAVGELLRGMEEAGLVIRTPPPGPGRPASVRLSDYGAARLDLVTPAVLEAVSPAALGLEDDESAELGVLLHRVEDHLLRR